MSPIVFAAGVGTIGFAEIVVIVGVALVAIVVTRIFRWLWR